MALGFEFDLRGQRPTDDPTLGTVKPFGKVKGDMGGDNTVALSIPFNYSQSNVITLTVNIEDTL